MLARVGQTHEQTPPVVDQRRDPRHEPTTLEIVAGESTPAPVIFELIKMILAVAPIAVAQ